MILLQSINPPVIFTLFVFLIITIAILSYFFSTKQKIKRTLSKLPIKQIGSLKTNEFSRVTGKALHVKEPLIAPYSKRKCISYVMIIQQKKKNGKNSYWDTLIKDEKIQPFFLEKNGDFLIVKPTQNPKNYTSHLVIDNKTRPSFFHHQTPEFKALLNHYSIDSKGFFGFNKTLRYFEGVIEIGEEITVAGIAKWKRLKEPIEGYSYSKIAELESSENQKLIITDLPNIQSQKRI